jgi:Transposase
MQSGAVKISRSMKYKRYTAEQKAWAVGQMKSPDNRTVVELAKETGITEVSLRHWRDQARASGELVPAGLASERWSSAEKFRAVLEAAPLSLAERGQYCRAKAILPEQLEHWRLACEGANEELGQTSGALGQVVSPTLQERVRQLERELRRKTEALAETAALLVLGKKADAIWGRREQPAEEK